MTAIGVVGLCLICFSAGAIFIAVVLAGPKGERYANPALHPGEDWRLSVVAQDRVTWTHPVLKDHSRNHEHVIQTCSIGPGMAHVDTCWCKAERYGVYGAWS